MELQNKLKIFEWILPETPYSHVHEETFEYRTAKGWSWKNKLKIIILWLEEKIPTENSASPWNDQANNFSFKKNFPYSKNFEYSSRKTSNQVEMPSKIEIKFFYLNKSRIYQYYFYFLLYATFNAWTHTIILI